MSADGQRANLRVACICPYALELPGGVQNQVLGLAKALRDRSVDVQLIAPGSSTDAPSIDGVSVVGIGRVHSWPTNESRAPISLSASVLPAMKKALKEFAPDVLHIHEPLVPLLGMAALWTSSRPVVATFHRAGDGLGYRLARPIARMALRRVTTSVAVSEAARDTLYSVLGRRPATTILHNAVDLGRFDTGVRSKNTTPTVVFIGRHERRKGLEVLLAAVAAGDVACEVIVIGSGPQTHALKERFAGLSQVIWCGAISDQEVARVLSAASLCVAPSLFGESFGVVLLEAMAAGTPVIASDLPGYRLAGGDAAVYVAPGDSEALGRAIVELLGDAKRREDLVRRGALRAAAHSFLALSESYLQLYQQAAAGAR